MITTEMESVIHFRHAQAEVAQLERTAIPLMDCIKAVAYPTELPMMRRIFGGEYFRLREDERVRAMLLRSIKYAKANLNEYFPQMRDGVLINCQRLDDALSWYWGEFQRLRHETEPVH